MKQKIIQATTLVVFASLIATFVWYNVQKNKVRPQPKAEKTVAKPKPVQQDTVPVADGTAIQPLKHPADPKTPPAQTETEVIEKIMEDIPPHMMAGSKSAVMIEPTPVEAPSEPFIITGMKQRETKSVPMMAGSKSAILAEPKFIFPNPHVEKKKSTKTTLPNPYLKEKK